MPHSSSWEMIASVEYFIIVYQIDTFVRRNLNDFIQEHMVEKRGRRGAAKWRSQG